MERYPGLGLLAITSPDRLHADWVKAQRLRAKGEAAWSHVETLLGALDDGAALVTVMDGHPLGLDWLGGVMRHRVHALGVTAFGQSGDQPDLYRVYGLDARAIAGAAEEAVTRGQPPGR